MRFFEPAPVPRVKLCGFTSLESARDAIAAGADAIGINFWPGSKRFLAPPLAAPWLGPLAGQVCRVGLLVDPALEEIEAIVDLGVLDALQLHGVTDPAFFEEATSFGLPVIQAIPVGPDGPLQDPADFPTPWILLDTHVPGAFGGTGTTFGWDTFRAIAAGHPEQRFILAGGLTPENVADALRATHPYAHAVDTASGVEFPPGQKDPAPMRQLVATVHATTNPD